MLAVGLALSSSLLYGVSDFLGGVYGRRHPLLSVLLLSQASGLVALIAVTALSGDALPAREYVLLAFAGGLAETLGVAALYRGLATGTMGIVAPVAATAPVVPIVGAAVLGELPSALQGAGIVLALLGIGTLSLAGGERGPHARVRASVILGLLTAVGFGGFLVAIDGASEGSVPWALLVARGVTVSIFAVLFAIRRRPLGVPAASLPVLAAIGCTILAADALYALATTKGLLSVVAVLSSLYPVVTMALARVVLGERTTPLQRMGAAVTLGGAVLISI
jgi:drug/metabolite transporter (DMT)-like permease